jgi:hypothetical protein
MTPKRLIQIGLAMLVVLLVLACIIWPIVPYIAGWLILFDGWKVSLWVRAWHLIA